MKQICLPCRVKPGTFWRGIAALIPLILAASWLPFLSAQAAPAPDIVRQAQEGVWTLTGTDFSDTWRGDKFHGLDSEYSPFSNGESIGAVYTQYNLRFNKDAPQTLASELTGTCSWDWNGGGVPHKILPGNGYPFSMSANASYFGNNLLGATVNAVTRTAEGGDFAFSQAYLDVTGQNTTARGETSATLMLSAGQGEGDTRTVTLVCSVDIVTVTQTYFYSWKRTGCTATLALPSGMTPKNDFTPQATVIDFNNKTIQPDQATWFYNDAAAELPMKWDGKAGTVRYDYVCPDEEKTRTTSISIPAASSCAATLSLPENMEADKEFTPLVSVVDINNNTVAPKQENWYYNGAASSTNMKWDGKQAEVRYDYTCPGESEVKTVSIIIPPAKTCIASIVLPETMLENEAFTPTANVVDLVEQKLVIPLQEKWYYEGELATLPIIWDGSKANLKYEYVCPLDMKLKNVETTIPGKDNTWIVVVGGLAAVAAAALTVIGITNGKKGKSKKDSSAHYILQVDRSLVELHAQESQSVNIQAWKVNPDGSTEPASTAALLVSLPAVDAGVTAAPVSGTGGINCVFSLPHPTACADVPVTITASAAGQKVSTMVTVRIIPLYELDLSWVDPEFRQLEPGGKEVYAKASVKATPMPEPRTTPDDLARRITLRVEGPNGSLVVLSTPPPGYQRPYVQSGVLWIPIHASALPVGTSPETGNPSLFALFTDGNQKVESELPLELKGESVFGAWVLGRKQADVLFDAHTEPPHWTVPDIVAFFHDPMDDNLPVTPGFGYSLDNNSVQFDPDVLLVEEIYAHAKDQYTLKCEVNPSVNLEDHFGENLEEHGGIIKVTITPHTALDNAKPAIVFMQLRPQFELFATQGDEAAREYKQLQLKPLEVVLDGDDILPLYVGVCRSDKLLDLSECPENELDPALWTFKSFLKGSLADEFNAEPDAESPSDEAPKILIKSKRPMLSKTKDKTGSLSLHLEGMLGNVVPIHYLRTLASFDLELKPESPSLKLWVVPGKHRGTSEAWMVAYLGGDPNRRLADTILNVKVESKGEGKLLTPDGDEKSSVITGQDGSEQVILWYKGMDWSNFKQATFSVSATLNNRTGDQESEPVKQTINIGENVNGLLSDLLASAQALKLNNPYYEDPSLGLTDLISLTTYRSDMRGPAWNASVSIDSLIVKDGGKPHFDQFARQYVCSEFRDRIAEWLITRRHYRSGSLHTIEHAIRMNGIEFDHFTIGGVHQYEALFLSGMEPTADPRGLDPWWNQHWHDTAYRDADGLMSNNWERAYCVEAAAWLQIAMTPLAVLGIWSGGVTIAVLIELLGPVIVAYTAATAGELGSRWEMGTAYEGGQYHFEREDNRYNSRESFLKDWTASQAGE